MAGSDYYRCDRCDRKAFYDANIDYNEAGFPGYVGDMKALCAECAKTHEVVIREMTPDEAQERTRPEPG